MRQCSDLVQIYSKRHLKLNNNKNVTQKRFFSSTLTRSEQIRVAIIGGGASGLSTALQLSPLVERGIIAKPIDLYEKSCLSDAHPHEKSSVIDENFHPGSGAVGRDIGVGIWSTALEPFMKTSEHARASEEGKASGSHFDLIEKLEHAGQYVDKVGYRTPSGSWLTRSRLNSIGVRETTSSELEDPSLLFIQEKKFLSSLREAVGYEEHNYGTIRTHYAKTPTDTSTEVDTIELQQGETNFLKGRLKFADNSTSSESYHFIVDTSGMQSSLRSKYGGYGPFIKKWKKNKDQAALEFNKEWRDQQLYDKHSIMDRRYVVFRGNSPLNGVEAGMNGESFQTWGEGKNMRFAAVAMSNPNETNTERHENQVWFATICDAEVSSNKDAEERKRLLLKSFKDWHNPICKLIESTPAEKIFMERGVGHKHSVCPVMNLSEVLDFQAQCSGKDRSFPNGHGPVLLFVGDANITVDPVLAQGFTIGMEAAADLAGTLDSCLQNIEGGGSIDYDALRIAIDERSTRRFDRMMCLIRSTDIVQFLAQPSSEFGITLTKYLVRPAMMLIPSFIKQVAFSGMMKYSLGYYSNCNVRAADIKK